MIRDGAADNVVVVATDWIIECVERKEKLNVENFQVSLSHSRLNNDLKDPQDMKGTSHRPNTNSQSQSNSQPLALRKKSNFYVPSMNAFSMKSDDMIEPEKRTLKSLNRDAFNRKMDMLTDHGNPLQFSKNPLPIQTSGDRDRKTYKSEDTFGSCYCIGAQLIYIDDLEDVAVDPNLFSSYFFFQKHFPNKQVRNALYCSS